MNLIEVWQFSQIDCRRVGLSPPNSSSVIKVCFCCLWYIQDKLLSNVSLSLGVQDKSVGMVWDDKINKNNNKDTKIVAEAQLSLSHVVETPDMKCCLLDSINLLFWWNVSLMIRKNRKSDFTTWIGSNSIWCHGNWKSSKFLMCFYGLLKVVIFSCYKGNPEISRIL